MYPKLPGFKLLPFLYINDLEKICFDLENDLVMYNDLRNVFLAIQNLEKMVSYKAVVIVGAEI